MVGFDSNQPANEAKIYLFTFLEVLSGDGGSVLEVLLAIVRKFRNKIYFFFCRFVACCENIKKEQKQVGGGGHK